MRARLVVVPAFALLLSGCLGATLSDLFEPSTASGGITKPLKTSDLVGSWGLAAYHRGADAAKVEQAARGECGQPYRIAAGRSGSVMMHLPDQTQTSEMVVKPGLTGTYIGPAGEGGGLKDREVVKWDGRVLALRWLDPEVASRYGTMVFARCGGRA